MALYGNFVSVKQILAKVYRDLDLKEEDRIGDMVEWVAEALDYIGTFEQYVTKTLKICVDNYSGILPPDFAGLNMISYNGYPLKRSSDIFGPTHRRNIVTNTNTSIINEASLYNSVFVGNLNNVNWATANYSIEGRIIRTSFPEGEIIIGYTARQLDEENWPMIPDNQEFKEAVFRYIVYKLYYIEWLRGKITSGMYEKIEQDWWRKCKQARAEAKSPDLNNMINIAKQYLSLKPNLTASNNFFADLNRTLPTDFSSNTHYGNYSSY